MYNRLFVLILGVLALAIGQDSTAGKEFSNYAIQ
jgi:hypothetical protein